jgi:DNA-binding transcriptional LysR family regulator
MELRHLRYFVAVAEELHFGRAAARLNLAQPPLSQQIRSLEHELGVTLLNRTSRRVELTQEGRFFLDHARGTLRQAERAIEVVRAVGKGKLGRITVAFITSAIYGTVPAILREFHLRHPGIEIDCREMNPSEQVEALRSGEIDLGFLRTPLPASDIETIPIAANRLILAVQDNHRLAERRKVDLSEFSKESFIAFPHLLSPAYYDCLCATCRAAGFSPRITQEARECSTLLALVGAGLGVALLPDALRSLQQGGVTYLDLAVPSEPIEVALARRLGESTPVIEAFLAVAREVAPHTPPRQPKVSKKEKKS